MNIATSSPARSNFDLRFDLNTQQKLYLAAVAAALLLYLLTRLYQLTLLPPFIDESIHIQWARDTWNGQLLAGGWDGKFLSIKIMALFMTLPLNPLMAGRLASVVIGTGTVCGCVMLGKALFSWRAGLIAAYLYVLIPYALFHERLALTDNYQTFFLSWTLFFAIMTMRSRSRTYVIMLTVFLCAAILAKLTALVFIAVPPMAAIVLLKPRDWFRGLLKTLPAVLLAVAIVGVLVWRGYAHQITEKTSDTGASQGALALIATNVQTAADWYVIWLTPAGAVLALLSIGWVALRRHDREHLLLIGVLLVMIGPLVVLSTAWFSRYLLFTVVPIALLVADFLNFILRGFQNKQWIPKALAAAVGLVGLVFVGQAAALNWTIMSDPYAANIPPDDRAQYMTAWSAGRGIEETAQYLKDQSAQSPEGINVLRYFYWDQPYQGLNLFLDSSPQLSLYLLDPAEVTLPEDIEQQIRLRPSFFVVNRAAGNVETPPLIGAAADLQTRLVWSSAPSDSDSWN